MMRPVVLVSVLAVGCGSSPPSTQDPDAPPGTGPDAPAEVAPLEVHALGVQGFVLHHGSDTILTAPMFTRQSTFEVGLNLPLPSDTGAVEAGLATVPLGDLRAIVSGHAHYDHFIDVPHILAMAPGSVVYTNLTGRNILAALAPDRPAGCTNTPAQPLARSRVIALDDALASKVDYTNCPAQRPAGAPLEGSWIDVPGSHVRIMAFCSMHPDQIGPFHFGEGSIDSEQCELPAAASGWLEGQTLAFLIDFLDDAGTPTFRVYYQDAPTNAPLGEVPPTLLAERGVDLALLCVGSNDAVDNQPTNAIANLQPRFVFSGHWEDFFRSTSDPIQPIPLLNLDLYVERAEAALPGSPDAPLLVDGAPQSTRHVLVQPGTRLIVPPRR
ncbi:MAG TPA: hypothetical protein VFQ53_39525 [Kofleriaceae bacterium]|nr:hypothetical protein [Kofleriaceae bacterium]